MLRYEKRLRALALCYAALAGAVDAIGFLSSGGLFVSFMTGNSTLLAIGLARVTDVAIAAGALIFLFVLGVVLNVLASESVGPRYRKVCASLGVALLLSCAAAADSLKSKEVTVGCLCLAMGAANAIFRREGEVSIGVTYMTGTLVRMGHRIADSLRGRGDREWLAYFLLWLALVSGGIAGASAVLVWPNRSLRSVALVSMVLVAATYSLHGFKED